MVSVAESSSLEHNANILTKQKVSRGLEPPTFNSIISYIYIAPSAYLTELAGQFVSM